MSILLETALAHLTHNGIEDSFNVKKQSTFKIDLLERIQKAYLNFKIIRCITLDYVYSISESEITRLFYSSFIKDNF